MSKLTVLLVLGLAASSGCSSSSTTATASGVFPSEGFTGRKLRVEISGDATDWKDGATVTMGDGVTVDMVAVASQTDLFADITIGDAAAPGLRDVSVSSGGSFVLKQAFELKAPITIAYTGIVAQGGFPAFTITGHDFDTPFDLTTDPMTGAYSNLVVTSPPGTKFTVSSATAYELKGFASVDIDATPGPVSVASGPAGSVITSTGDAMAVMPRTATALTSGTAATGMLANVDDTVLYSIAATGSPALVHLTAKTTDPNGAPASVILGASGHWVDAIGNDHAILPTGGQAYIVVFDGGSAANYSFTINAYGEALTSAAWGSDTHKTTATALVAAGVPFLQTGGMMTSATDVDYIQFVAPGGRKLHVITNAGNDPQTDTAVEIVTGTAGTTSVYGPINNDSQCGFFGCANGGEDVVVPTALAAGTYWVKITAGANYAAAHTAFVAMLWFD